MLVGGWESGGGVMLKMIEEGKSDCVGRRPGIAASWWLYISQTGAAESLVYTEHRQLLCVSGCEERCGVAYLSTDTWSVHHRARDFSVTSLTPDERRIRKIEHVA